MVTRELIAWRPRVVDPAVASVRIRCLAPLRELARRGVAVELFDARRAARYAVVVYSKAYDERCRSEAAALKAAGTRIVFDLCDDHFHFPPGRPKLARRAEELRLALRAADAVVVSTDALAEVVRAETGVAPAAVIDDAVETELERPDRGPFARLGAWAAASAARRWLARRRAEGRTLLAWFGAWGGPYAASGVADLARIAEPLHAVARRHPIALTVISNRRAAWREAARGWELPTRYVEWDAGSAFALLRAHAIAVVPVTPSPFSRCKSANRVAQALALGLAVVADPIPAYAPFAGAIVLGGWEEGLERYLADPARRAADVESGRAIVRARCSIERIATQWQELLVRGLESPAGKGGEVGHASRLVQD